MLTRRLNHRSSATKLSKRWLWPSHFHLNGSVEDRLLSSSLKPNSLNKSQWADEKRKTLLLSYTNSIWFAQCGCTWQQSFDFICSSVSSCPLTIWAIMKLHTPSFFCQHCTRTRLKCIEHMHVMNILLSICCACNRSTQFQNEAHEYFNDDNFNDYNLERLCLVHISVVFIHFNIKDRGAWISGLFCHLSV